MQAKSAIREILSGLLGGSAFLLFVFVIETSLLVSIIVGVVVYTATVLIFSPTRLFGVDLTSLVGVSPALFNKTMQEGYETLESMKVSMKQIPVNSSVRGVVEKICSSTEKILEEVKKNPRNYKAIRSFFTSYLSRTKNILNIYVGLSNQNINNNEIRERLVEVENMLIRVEQAYEVQRKKLYENDLFDLVVDMKVLDSQLEMEEEIGHGLLNSEGGRKND